VVIARARSRPTEYDADGTHAVMGVATAGMLTASLKFLPNGVWAVLFGLAGAWFTWRVARDHLAARAGQADGRPVRGHRGHDVPILLMCGAMVYMLLAGPSMAAGSGGMGMGAAPGGSHFTILAFVLALALFGYAIWETDHLPALARVRALAHAQLTPAVALAGAPSAGAPLAGLADGAAQGQSGPAPAGHGAPLSPRLAACCQIVMAVTMAYMLVLMV
jgi:hypothetical protein